MFRGYSGRKTCCKLNQCLKRHYRNLRGNEKIQLHILQGPLFRRKGAIHERKVRRWDWSTEGKEKIGKLVRNILTSRAKWRSLSKFTIKWGAKKKSWSCSSEDVSPPTSPNDAARAKKVESSFRKKCHVNCASAWWTTLKLCSEALASSRRVNKFCSKLHLRICRVVLFLTFFLTYFRSRRRHLWDGAAQSAFSKDKLPVTIKSSK